MTHDDFLVEILCEELPPKSLLKLATAFHDSIIEQLGAHQLSFKNSQLFATPRRLGIKIDALQKQQAEQTITRQGPSMKAAYVNGEPTKAALAFAQSCGVELSALEQGEKLSFTQTVPGKTIFELMPSIIEKALASLPIAKRMRWSDREDLFVRPVHNSVMLYGDTIIPAIFFNLKTSNTTVGHRFHHPETITIRHAKDYESALEKAHVLVDFQKRKMMIQQQTEALAKKLGGSAIIPDALLNEVTGLVEWPVALVGHFDRSFLETPKESLISAMQEHQKSFAVVDSQDNLLPHFITISNIESKNPASVMAGNERVMNARLSDAKFFFDQDKHQSLESRLPALQSITYQAKLGSVYDRTQRIVKISTFLATHFQADLKTTERAALLCKTDLSSDMVGEFPELQGLMGYYYALHDGENKDVALAIKEHYQPKFSGDALPATLPGIILAVADRVESLVGLFSIGQMPTGDKDPFGLRRAALGVLRLIVENRLSLDLAELLKMAMHSFEHKNTETIPTLLAFFQDRLRPWYNEQGIGTDVVAAVTALSIHNPYDVHQRILAVNEFKKRPEAVALAAANKRVSNILKKQTAPTENVNSSLLQEAAEKNLYHALEKLTPTLDAKTYGEILNSLASLREPIDQFFEHVMVMADNIELRHNRLALLNQLRTQFLRVADIALLQEMSS